MSAHLHELAEQARPWIRGPRHGNSVATGDRRDDIVFDRVRDECTALAQLDADLGEHYGADRLVEDLWRAAYGRRPEVLEAGEVAPGQWVNREITAGMVGSPEHAELRRATVGDPYAAALAVVAQGPSLRRLLTSLSEQQEQASQTQQAQDVAEDCSAELQQALAGAAQAAGQDGAVGRPEASGVQSASGAAEAAAAEAEECEGELEAELAAAPVRAAVRQAAQNAVEEVTAEQGVLAAWGADAAELQRLDPDERMRLAERLRSGKLGAWTELIGRFRQLAQAQRSRRVEHVTGEYVGVTLGDELSAVIPSELVNLAVPALRAEFAARYAEQRLMVYDQRGEEHEGQGAVIAVVDCSYSMQMPWSGIGEESTAEAYAKAVSLALLEQARAATPAREFAAVLFSEDVDTVLRFPAHEPVCFADRVELAERFSGGGTSFEAPLDAAMRLLAAEYNTSGRQRADIVFITDGEAPLTPEWLQHWRNEKHRLGFRCFGISIDVWAGEGFESTEEQLSQVCDDVRTVADLADTHAAAGMFRAI